MPNDIPDWTNESIVTGAVDITTGSVAVSAGQNGVNVSTDTPPVLLGTLSAVSTDSNAQTGTFNLPVNATGVFVILISGGSSGMSNIRPRVEIIGGVSGQIYADVRCPYANYLTNLDGVLATAAVPGSSENAITVNTTYHDTGIITPKVVAYVYALLGTGVQTVYTTPAEPLNALLVPPVSVPQVGNVLSAYTQGNQTNGNNIAVVAGVSGRQIVVLGWDFIVQPTNPASTGAMAAILEDTTGTIVVAATQSNINTAVGQTGVKSNGSIPHGIPLPVGAGLQYHISAAASTTVVGTVQYVVV